MASSACCTAAASLSSRFCSWGSSSSIQLFSDRDASSAVHRWPRHSARMVGLFCFKSRKSSSLSLRTKGSDAARTSSQGEPLKREAAPTSFPASRLARVLRRPSSSPRRRAVPRSRKIYCRACSPLDEVEVRRGRLAKGHSRGCKLL